MIVMETERLTIRDHVPEDLPDLCRLLSDPVVMHFLPDLQVADLAGAEANLRIALEEAASPQRTRYFFAVLEKETGRYVGEIGFTVLGRGRDGTFAEMGYFILEAFWGRGYVTEAGRRVLRFAFEEAGLGRMLIGCNAANAASERVMVKLGFVKLGEREAPPPRDGDPARRVEYHMDRCMPPFD